MTQTAPPHVSCPLYNIDVANKAPIVVFKGWQAKKKKKSRASRLEFYYFFPAQKKNIRDFKY
jgi:hypothetical protein